MKDCYYDLAKQMYWDYECSHFFMEREGEYEDYLKFQVPQYLEIKWKKEFQNNLLTKYIKCTAGILERKVDLLLIISTIDENTRDMLPNIIDVFVKTFDTFDTYSQLHIIRRILDRSNKLSGGINSNVSRKALDLLKHMLKKPISISSEYTQDEDWVEFNENYTVDMLREEISSTIRSLKKHKY